MEKKMLEKYLKGFQGRREIVFLVADPKRRLVYQVEEVFAITDAGVPVLCVQIGGERNMDEDEQTACEEDESAVAKV